jgi:hypothetical protein
MLSELATSYDNEVSASELGTPLSVFEHFIMHKIMLQGMGWQHETKHKTHTVAISVHHVSYLVLKSELIQCQTCPTTHLPKYVHCALCLC